jgi:DNA-binding IclR family transcriptional regulator
MINRQGQQGHIRVKSPTVTAKVCAIVLAVSDAPEPSISEVARHTGLPASTTHRLLSELVQGGLLERNPAGRFTVCVELQLLLGPRQRAAHARSLVGTVLEDLAVATGLRARFGVWHPTGISYLEQAPDIPPGSCKSGRRLLPAHATASGKAMLAHAPPWMVAGVIKRGLPAYTPLTLTTAEQLHKDLLITRTSAFATSRGEWRAHECAMATPVLGPHGVTVGALELVTDVYANRARLSSTALAIAARSLGRQLAADPSLLPTGSGPAPLQWRADPTSAALSWRRPEEVG